MSQALGIVTAGAQFGLETLMIKPQRQLGPFLMQVVLEETHTDELEITDHPIEVGAIISDHAFKRPAEVVIKCGWSNSPSQSGLIDGLVGGLKSTVTGIENLLGGKLPTEPRDIYDRLLKLQSIAVPFNIYTGKRNYTDMLIRALTTTTDKQTENALLITVVCRQLIMVQTQVVAVPASAGKQAFPRSTQEPVKQGTRNLQQGANFSNAGAGRGFINPSNVNP